MIGVLGGIAAGKSEVSRAFAGDGGIVIDADDLAHEALQAAAVVAWVRDRIGAAAIVDGHVDRAAVAERVFGAPVLRRELERLVHPLVGDSIRSQLDRARAQRVPRVALDVPLLLENDAEHQLVRECDVLVFVEADARVRAERAARRRGWTPQQLSQREATQLPLEQKRARAEFVVVNDGDLDQLRAAAARALVQIEARRRGR